MQNNTVRTRKAITLYETSNQSFTPTDSNAFAYLHSNAAAVPKLTLKDKAGLVFVVAVLLMLQVLEKLKVIK